MRTFADKTLSVAVGMFDPLTKGARALLFACLFFLIAPALAFGKASAVLDPEPLPTDTVKSLSPNLQQTAHWTTERTWKALYALGFAAVSALLWVISLRRKVASQTALLKEQLARQAQLQEHYRGLFENNPHPMQVFDPKTLRFLAVNDTAIEQYGFSREEFLSMTVLDIRPNEDREPTRALLERTHGRVEDGRLSRHLRKDGSQITAEITTRRISFEGQEAILVLCHDVTERAAAEAALRASETKFRRLVESSLIGIAFFDSTGVIMDANDCLLTMVGRTRDELKAGRLKNTDFAAADRQDRLEGALKGLRERGISPPTRREYLRSDGRRVPAMVGAVALGQNNFAAFVLDLTKETALEQQVVLAQKMEAVGLLAGGVAHDFNNLLQVIQGYTLVSMEMCEYKAPSSAELRDNLRQVQNASERAAELTRQLLVFSRQDNSIEAEIDVAAALGETLKLVRRVIGTHIEVEFHAASDLSSIRGDKSQIEQILMNLCVNARDSMPKGGRLTIELSNAALGEVDSEIGKVNERKYVRVAVTDTGCGMDSATLARIYEPFFTTKSKDKGSGLGLSIVYGIVERHRGEIRVQSKVGVGTTFLVYFPAISNAANQLISARGDYSDKTGMETILLVEDEPAVRMLAARVLKRAGYQVREAADGAEACAFFKEHAPEIDLVLMDVIMPKMGGRDAYENIVKTRSDIPVIFCSGYSERELGAEFLQSQDVDLLPKPYRPDELLAHIRRRLHPEAKHN